MAGKLKVNSVQLGDSATATQNFVLKTNVDGTATLARGNDGATTQDILTVDANGIVTVTNGVNGLIAKTPVAIGYGTGAGGSVTQATSKSTAVTLNKPTGQIIMNGAALAAGAIVNFSLLNTLISATDLIIINSSTSSSNFQNYRFSAFSQNGNATITVQNISASSLADQVLIYFAIIKGATS